MLIRTNSSNVSAKFEMLGGRQPPKLLFAKTKTVAELRPRFGGIEEVNPLLLRKIASNDLLKSSGGSGPSNSL